MVCARLSQIMPSMVIKRQRRLPNGALNNGDNFSLSKPTSCGRILASREGSPDNFNDINCFRGDAARPGAVHAGRRVDPATQLSTARFVDRSPGARLNVVGSNLEVMHQPLGDLLARKYPVIAIDRPRALGARMALDHAEHLLPDSSCRHRLPIPGAASAGTPGR